MKVILMHDVKGIGKKYEIKDVGDGHALNMLIPRGMARVATADAIKKVEIEKARATSTAKVREDLIMKNIADLSGKVVTIKEKANAKGALFAGIHLDEIAAIVKRETHLDMDPAWIVLDKPIKSTGSFEIVVKIQDKTATFTLNVEAL